MCGFVGFLNRNQVDNYELNSHLIKKMSDTLAHRGPDSEGFWQDVEHGIAFGHRRLSILDLSKNGHQPMISNDGRYVLVYNGEIYNHKEILNELKINFNDINLRGHSDTEILLSAISKWGIENTLKKISGMFSFSLWCKKEKKLYLARDRVGEKPLFFGWQGKGINKTLFFGSELKALKKHPNFENVINRSSVESFFKYSYIHAPDTIYQNIHKLMPGTFLEYDYFKDKTYIKNYWSLVDRHFEFSKMPYEKNLEDATEELNLILNKSVTQQMQSDVPYGSFLSGGIDSSTITALMQFNSNKQINTFSIGFNEKNYDESKYAKSIAKYLGTNHHEMILKSQDVKSVLNEISEIYDEPFADSSQIPTVLLSRLAKNKVTVALSGDGADEIFGGYNRYVFTEIIWKRIKFLPNSLKKFLGYLASNIDFIKIKFMDNYIKDFSNKFKKVSQLVQIKNIQELYYNFISTSDNNEVNTELDDKDYFINDLLDKLKFLDSTEKIMIMDILTYLPNDILAKVDRASMSTSLETRMPFLDHKVIEFSLRLPLKYKIHNRQTKIILKNVLNKYIPTKLIERPKSGFAMPIGEWLRSDLRDWGSDLLHTSIINEQNFFETEKIKLIWKEHLDGKKNHEKILWSTLIFQAWLNNN